EVARALVRYASSGRSNQYGGWRGIPGLESRPDAARYARCILRRRNAGLGGPDRRLFIDGLLCERPNGGAGRIAVVGGLAPRSPEALPCFRPIAVLLHRPEYHIVDYLMLIALHV